MFVLFRIYLLLPKQIIYLITFFNNYDSLVIACFSDYLQKATTAVSVQPAGEGFGEQIWQNGAGFGGNETEA